MGLGGVFSDTSLLSAVYGFIKGWTVYGDLSWDILILGFEDKSFGFEKEVLDILENNFVVAVFFLNFCLRIKVQL